MSVVSVYLRAGWSLGNTQDRYIFSGPGGDETVGRVVCGLPVNDTAFCALPPHFTLSDLEVIKESVGWESVVENYDKYPASFKHVIHYLVASIVFHDSYLQQTLPESHMLFNSKLYTHEVCIGGVRRSLVNHFRGKILGGVGKCAATGMVASGIPPHLVTAYEMKQLREVFFPQSTVLSY